MKKLEEKDSILNTILAELKRLNDKIDEIARSKQEGMTPGEGISDREGNGEPMTAPQQSVGTAYDPFEWIPASRACDRAEEEYGEIISLSWICRNKGSILWRPAPKGAKHKAEVEYLTLVRSFKSRKRTRPDDNEPDEEEREKISQRIAAERMKG